MGSGKAQCAGSPTGPCVETQLVSQHTLSACFAHSSVYQSLGSRVLGLCVQFGFVDTSDSSAQDYSAAPS